METTNPPNLNELHEHRKSLILLIEETEMQFGSSSELTTLKCGLRHLDEMILDIGLDVDTTPPAANEDKPLSGPR